MKKTQNYYANHRRPRTRREFLAQGLVSGVGSVLVPTLGGGLIPYSTLKAATLADCDGGGGQAAALGGLPLICVDCSGGATLAASVMVGGPNGQMDAGGVGQNGYRLLGYLPEMLDNVSDELGLRFQADSGILRGIQSKTTAATRANVNGAVFATASNDDSGNNALNPAYAVAKAGAVGQLTTLVGTRNSDSGGKSAAIELDPAMRPSVIAKATDATGLVDSGGLSGAQFVTDAIQRLSMMKLNKVQEEKALEDIIHCASLMSAKATSDFGDPTMLNPLSDPNLMSIVTQNELGNETFDKLAGVMKLVVNGFAAAGTIEVGGADYHNGTRARGEQKDFEIGQVIGSVLEYAAMQGRPVMVYVFSDGAAASNGQPDDSQQGGGKPAWAGDDGSRGSTFFLVYSPNGRPQMRNPKAQQVGYFNANGSVALDSSPVAASANTASEALTLNYLALAQGEAGIGKFQQLFSASTVAANQYIDTHTSFSGM